MLKIRVGLGYDVHRLVEGRPLILGGVHIDYERGLMGHSDADALCHAVIDALLGAAALGDIGRHFPDTDERWRGADSIHLLRQTVAMLANQGYLIGNIDAVISAERPKMKPYVESMRERLAGALGIDVGAVGIKAKTEEGLGPIGRGEGIAVRAVALIFQASGGGLDG